jgi:hypothetical protein
MLKKFKKYFSGKKQNETQVNSDNDDGIKLYEDFKKLYNHLAENLMPFGSIYIEKLREGIFHSLTDSEILVHTNDVHTTLENILSNLGNKYELRISGTGNTLDKNEENERYLDYRGVQWINEVRLPKENNYSEIEGLFDWQMSDFIPFKKLSHFLVEAKVEANNEKYSINILLGDLTKLKDRYNPVNDIQKINDFELYLN